MKLKALALSFVLACAAAAAARQADKSSEISWSDSTRDIYVNAEADRTAQLLFNDTPRRYALVSDKLDRAVILDLAEQTVSTTPKDAFRFAADRSTASTAADLPVKPAGKYTVVEPSMYLLSLDGKSILIRPHLGITGEVSKEEVFEAVPVWRSLMESYQPADDTVRALKAENKDTTITVALGTWCPDSKNYVPKLLKALEAAANPHLRVKFIAVDNQFHQPIAPIQKRRLVNVPTVIVERDGGEIGRIVETPASDTVEQDLVAILDGKPNSHKGRWDRGPRLARGAYIIRDQNGKQIGTEQWELFSTAEGGYLLHSETRSGELAAEVWHRADARRRPTFVEITRHRGGELSRTRYRVGEQNLTARQRGSQTGVIEQTISVPEKLTFSSLATAAEVWGWTEANQSSRIASYQAPVSFDATVGTLSEALFEAKGEEVVQLPAGQLRAKRVLRTVGGQVSEWWVHTGLNIAVRGKVAGGPEYVLTSLEIAPAAASK